MNTSGCPVKSHGRATRPASVRRRQDRKLTIRRRAEGAHKDASRIGGSGPTEPWTAG